MSNQKPKAVKAWAIKHISGQFWSCETFSTEEKADKFMNNFCEAEGWERENYQIIPVLIKPL